MELKADGKLAGDAGQIDGRLQVISLAGDGTWAAWSARDAGNAGWRRHNPF
jgi:hypothetical protein